MASFNYYLKDKKATKPTAIFLAFGDGTINKRIYIQQSILPKLWNNGKVRAGAVAKEEINLKLEKIKAECQRLYYELTKDGNFTFEKLKEKTDAFVDGLNNKQRTIGIKKYQYLTEFAEFYITSVQQLKAANTIRQHKQVLTVLKEFTQHTGKQYTFAAIDLDFYDAYKSYLMAIKNYNINTVSKHLRTIKLFLGEAVERGYNVNMAFRSKKFKAPQREADNIYLTESEINKIRDTDLKGNNRLGQVRDLFLIGCHTGLRFSDFSQLKAENIQDDRIRVLTQKTRQSVVIPIHDNIKPILDKYTQTVKGAPRAISNQKMNQYLKELCELAGITDMVAINKEKGGVMELITCKKCDLVSTHTARRSFATNENIKGTDRTWIMMITGHKTETAFMKYIKTTNDQVADLMEKAWNERAKIGNLRVA